MQNILNLIRWKNLLMIAFVQLLVKYALFNSLAVDTYLSSINFTLLILSTLCIAAGGYIINDIYDVETDTINKPNLVIIGKHISESKANTLYMALTFIGVIIGFYLANGIGRPKFFGFFVIIAALLYVYSTSLKQIAVVGNIIVSFLVASSILIVGIFELLPAINEQNQNLQSTMFEVLADFGIFAFLLNFIREIVKDIQDVDGDYKSGMQTLPIILGKSRTAKIAFTLTLITIAIIIFYVTKYLFMHKEVVIYFLIMVVGPLIYTAIKLFTAEKNSEFKHISFILKLTMLTGMLVMVLYWLIF
ncbi:geranylgeranylglycerol-phosphate geranylgeranyltransferase [Pontimicrobium sp. MEBiC01747]